MIFISHAAPEDNEFSLWLALRLAKEGYPVWCDLTKLLGGEDFWLDIEEAIRFKTTKFLFILSRSSNKKQGTLQELAVAKQVARERHDFIIPLRVDDIPHADINIELHRLNAIDASKSWVKGFSQLLEKLELDSVPKDERFSPSTVAAWWREHTKSQGGVTQTGEAYASNWFKIGDLPEWLYLHTLEGEIETESKELPIGVPNYRFKSAIFTFEDGTAMGTRLRDHNLTIVASQEFRLEEFQCKGIPALNILRNEARNIVTNLLRRGFEMRCVAAGLTEYGMAGEAKNFWFPAGFSSGDKIEFKDYKGCNTYRRMVGYKTLLPKDGVERVRSWHFGIQGKVVRWPEMVFAIKSHVVFSEDGQIYESKARQHSARRSQCKLWHNDTWLGRMAAAMYFLADPSSQLFISVPLGSNAGFTIQTTPLLFESPVSYESAARPDIERILEDDDSAVPSDEDEIEDEDAAEGEDEE